VQYSTHPGLDAGQRGSLEAQHAGPVGDDQHDLGGTGGSLGLLYQGLQVGAWTKNMTHTVYINSRKNRGSYLLRFHIDSLPKKLQLLFVLLFPNFAPKKEIKKKLKERN